MERIVRSEERGREGKEKEVERAWKGRRDCVSAVGGWTPNTKRVVNL